MGWVRGEVTRTFLCCTRGFEGELISRTRIFRSARCVGVDALGSGRHHNRKPFDLHNTRIERVVLELLQSLRVIKSCTSFCHQARH
jgi:hypothetical protein